MNQDQKTLAYPLTFEKIRVTKIISTEGQKAFVVSNLHQSAHYETTLFYKPLCMKL